MSTVLPKGAVLLASDDQGQAYQLADQLVIERSFAGKRIKTFLPVGDLDWIWNWSQLLHDACDTLAYRELT